jgi:hypothetical protein
MVAIFPAHLTLLDLITPTKSGDTQIIKLSITHFSQFFRYCLHLSSKYSPQNPVPKYPHYFRYVVPSREGTSLQENSYNHVTIYCGHNIDVLWSECSEWEIILHEFSSI